MLWAYIVFVICSYLLGAIPYMLLLARARGVDFSQVPDLHAATWRKLGPLMGATGALVDILKGVIPVVAGFFLGFPIAVVGSGGVAAVMGQMWPVFRRFNGEGGNTPGLGLVLTLSIVYQAYLVFWCGFIPFLIGAGIRTVPRFLAKGQTAGERLRLGGPPSLSLPLGVIIGYALTPLSCWLLQQPLELTMTFLANFAVIVLRRLTVRLRADLKTAANRNIGSMLINRLLYDRSFL